MANQEHLAIVQRGVEAWNGWRIENPEIRPDLRGANLSGWDLGGADFSKTDPNQADLHESYFREANFLLAHLVESDLSQANLAFARLSRTSLSWAKLVGVNLSGADLNGAILLGTDLSSSICNVTTFGDVDLSGAVGLEAVRHQGPSTIGIDTLYLSKGKIPDAFLQGAGVPDFIVGIAHSLTATPIQYFSCFISHSSKDRSFCDRLNADLKARGVRVWYFPEDAKWGETVWSEIDGSIKTYDKLIVVCSEDSLQSVPVLREIERALYREDQERRNILFPIRIDDYIFTQWQHPRKQDVLNKVVGDFSDWDKNPSKYAAALEKLLEALKA